MMYDVWFFAETNNAQSCYFYQKPSTKRCLIRAILMRNGVLHFVFGIFLQTYFYFCS